MNLLNTIERLADHAASISFQDLPSLVQEAVQKSLLDSFAVGMAGQNTPELKTLSNSWPVETGPSRLWGSNGKVDVASATILNGTALCSLELDEGNKFARGHPGAHILPVTFAEAQRTNASGETFLNAYLAGYEIAARFARAFSPIAGLHPHGNWGAIGAAVSVTRLNGGDAQAIAQAIDAGSGLALASPFSSALKGSFVRNTWVGLAGVNGMTAARLVSAGLGTIDGTPGETFGRLLGALDIEALTEELGTRHEIIGGYYKRHSSCNYTHPPADAAIQLFETGVRIQDAVSIKVTTHKLATPLKDTSPKTRLAAMFSIPHVVAVALRDGKVEPDAFNPAALADMQLDRMRQLVKVSGDDAIDARLPHERIARVEVTLTNGETATAEVPNAVGDAAYHPFSMDDLVQKATRLLGEDRAAMLERAVRVLPLASDLNELDRSLT